MKFSINKNLILENLTNVNRAISSRNIIPILNGIKFELNSEGLYLTGSDSDLTIKSFIPREKIDNVEVEGTIIIQSKFILDIIRKLPSNVVNFEVIDGLKIVIYTETSKYNLNCLNSLDYPQIDIVENPKHINLQSKDIKEMIRQTILSISTQESRPLLTGINIKISGNIMECVATDSYRLSKKTIILNEPYDETVDIVIPGKNISELDKVINDEEKDVSLSVFSNKVLFKYDNILFQSNLLNGNYPNTSSFIPNEFSHIISVKLNDFYSAIDRAALLTQSKEKNIIKLETEEHQLTITSFASEIGRVEEHVACSRNNEEDLVISFNSKYMMDALKTFEDEEISLYMISDSKPMVIKSNKDESVIQLILPIKTY